MLERAATEAIPWDVAQGVRQRVALLPEAAREALGAAAVAGRRARVALLAEALGRPVGEMLDGLEAACRARLLVEDGDDAYAFAHDVIREVVEGDVGAARRAALHRRVAQALERGHGQGDDGDGNRAAPELLVYHYEAGGDVAAAARAAEEAGDRAWGQRALAAAEGSYGEALGRLEGLGPDGARAALRVREKLGEMRYQVGRYAEALDVLGPALGAYRVAGNQEGHGRVAARMAWAYARRGTPDTRAGAGEPSAPIPGVTAALHTALAMLLGAAGRFDEALAAGGERAGVRVGACRRRRARARAGQMACA